jgi:hypothetical protein
LKRRFQLVNFLKKYRYEAARLLTLIRGKFENIGLWPSQNPLRRCLEMSGDGLYHNPLENRPDNVNCEFCQLALAGWEEGDTIRDAHAQFNPECQFLINQNNVANTPLGQEQMDNVGHDTDVWALPDGEFSKLRS